MKQELKLKIGNLQNCLPDDHRLQNLDSFQAEASSEDRTSEDVLEKLEQRHEELQSEANHILGLINGLRFDAIDPENIDVDEVTIP